MRANIEFNKGEDEMEELFEKMAKELIAGKQDEVKKLCQDALDKGASAKQVLIP